MKKLFAITDIFLQGMSWKVLALVKLCLFAAGVTVGTALSPKRRRMILPIALVAFVATYIPLMVQFARTAIQCLRNPTFGKRAI